MISWSGLEIRHRISPLLLLLVVIACHISASLAFINGEPVKTALPWMVQIRLYYESVRISCGGGLISDK